ncbi:hypothetical protein AAFF_G00304930 [Aldrovandia affinis]|uniref:Uncharacterized protein n=1 Tax=Aldrovandia affinis TaxID=143900 RepID=A0AAD7SP39_9TELE|nr:hypothetical protein AAFF_G00304930 [Aldrovandia affinis]
MGLRSSKLPAPMCAAPSTLCLDEAPFGSVIFPPQQEAFCPPHSGRVEGETELLEGRRREDEMAPNCSRISALLQRAAQRAPLSEALAAGSLYSGWLRGAPASPAE